VVYEAYTFEFILNRMLNRVSNNIDKREGSVIYDALAPAAAELAQMYMEIAINYNLSFADTASGEHLTLRTAEFGVNRYLATKAIRKGEFFDRNNAYFNVPIDSRYAIDSLTFKVVEQLSTGIFKLESESTGIIGNQRFGSLLPVTFVADLVSAQLTEVLIPGEDEESDEALRVRYYVAINEPSFGGNVADYKQTINAIDGVGAAKIFPVWNGGGSVKATIIAADWEEPSSTLIAEVQTIVDPTVNSGQGLGTAPVGHEVTLAGAEGLAINVEAAVTLSAGVTVGQVQADIEASIAAYLLELRQDWANQTQLVVRVSQIDARILTVPNVEDVSGTELNEATLNITLGPEEIPVLGTVVINE
jgi:uncharacterized phage protein gp47/JayE